MKKVYIWAVSHRPLAILAAAGVLCGIYGGLFYLLDSPFWLVALGMVICLLLAGVTPALCINKLILPATKALNEQCDPYPLLEVTGELLQKKLAPSLRQLVLMDHGAALANLGQRQDYYDLLKNIHIDQYAGTLPSVKLVYYCNLAGVCTELGKYVEADLCTEKVRMFFADIKNAKQRAQLQTPVTLCEADACYRKKDYDGALNLLHPIKAEHWHAAVDRAMAMAKNYLAVGQKEYAREGLQFAVDHGNRLCSVQEARKLLEENL
ncbi:MAG: hypothetical protein IJ043_06175 [Clostridia bacterium]|nr:hypothetical protein [Clostridia bacterium]